MEHLLKCWPSKFDAIKRGEKTFEVRQSLDRDFAVGDVLVLQAFDPHTLQYTGPETIRARVTYFMQGPAFGIEAGYCVMSIRLIKDFE